MEREKGRGRGREKFREKMSFDHVDQCSLRMKFRKKVNSSFRRDSLALALVFTRTGRGKVMWQQLKMATAGSGWENMYAGDDVMAGGSKSRCQ